MHVPFFVIVPAVMGVGLQLPVTALAAMRQNLMVVNRLVVLLTVWHPALIDEAERLQADDPAGRTHEVGRALRLRRLAGTA